MKKKIWILLSIAILSTVYLLYVLLQSKQIEQEYRSIIYSNDTGFERMTLIKLKGNLYIELFGKDKFVGEITVDNDLIYEIKLNENGNQYFGVITTLDKMANVHTRGTVITSKKFDEVWVNLNDINQRYQLEVGYISGPAKNLEEANQIAREVIAED